MNNVPNTPAAVFAAYLNPAEAYSAQGEAAQVMWMQGYTEAKRARLTNAIASTALVLGASATILTGIVLTFG